MKDTRVIVNNFLKLANEMARRFKMRAKYANVGPLIEVRVPAVVDNLIARNIIDGESKQAMLNTLKDHAKCLLFIDKLTEGMVSGELGNAVKKSSKASSYTEQSEADRLFEQMLYRRV